MFASILSVAHNLGYPALVLLVMLESSGIPLPGETALITAAELASQHRLQIALVIALAAAAAILGDNAGYLIGRKGGRWLLLRPGPFRASPSRGRAGHTLASRRAISDVSSFATSRASCRASRTASRAASGSTADRRRWLTTSRSTSLPSATLTGVVPRLAR